MYFFNVKIRVINFLIGDDINGFIHTKSWSKAL